MSADRRYGQIPSTHGGILSELIGEDTETRTDTRAENRAETRVDSGDAHQVSGEVPVPTPPRPTPPRVKRTMYLTPELAEVYDRMLIEMHGQHRCVKGAVQDAMLAVGMVHRDDVEAVLRGER